VRHKLYMIAFFLGTLLITSPFINISFWKDAMNIPTISTTTKKIEMQILNMTIDFTQLKKEIVWPNGTKKSTYLYGQRTFQEGRSSGSMLKR